MRSNIKAWDAAETIFDVDPIAAPAETHIPTVRPMPALAADGTSFLLEDYEHAGARELAVHTWWRNVWLAAAAQDKDEATWITRGRSVYNAAPDLFEHLISRTYVEARAKLHLMAPEGVAVTVNWYNGRVLLEWANVPDNGPGPYAVPGRMVIGDGLCRMTSVRRLAKSAMSNRSQEIFQSSWDKVVGEFVAELGLPADITHLGLTTPDFERVKRESSELLSAVVQGRRSWHGLLHHAGAFPLKEISEGIRGFYDNLDREALGLTASLGGLMTFGNYFQVLGELEQGRIVAGAGLEPQAGAGKIAIKGVSVLDMPTNLVLSAATGWSTEHISKIAPVFEGLKAGFTAALSPAAKVALNGHSGRYVLTPFLRTIGALEELSLTTVSSAKSVEESRQAHVERAGATVAQLFNGCADYRMVDGTSSPFLPSHSFLLRSRGALAGLITPKAADGVDHAKAVAAAVGRTVKVARLAHNLSASLGVRQGAEQAMTCHPDLYADPVVSIEDPERAALLFKAYARGTGAGITPTPRAAAAIRRLTAKLPPPLKIGKRFWDPAIGFGVATIALTFRKGDRSTAGPGYAHVAKEGTELHLHGATPPGDHANKLLFADGDEPQVAVPILSYVRRDGKHSKDHLAALRTGKPRPGKANCLHIPLFQDGVLFSDFAVDNKPPEAALGMLPLMGEANAITWRQAQQLAQASATEWMQGLADQEPDLFAAITGTSASTSRGELPGDKALSLLQSAATAKQGPAATGILNRIRNPEFVNKSGKSALDIALEMNSPKLACLVVETLAARGAHSIYFERSLDRAIRSFDPEVVFAVAAQCNRVSEDQLRDFEFWGARFDTPQIKAARNRLQILRGGQIAMERAIDTVGSDQGAANDTPLVQPLRAAGKRRM